MGNHAEMIRRRFGSPEPSLQELSAESVATLIADCQAAVAGSHWAIAVDLDAGSVPNNALSAWVSHNIQHDGEVSAVWVPYRQGFTLNWRDFVLHLPEVWYPGADDLWVTSGSWGLLVDHEERFRVFRRVS